MVDVGDADDLLRWDQPPGKGTGYRAVKYFYDTEFIEDGVTIDLVSIGIVAEDGREYYAVSREFDPTRANPWVKDNVLSQLPSLGDPVWKSRQTIRQEVYAFLHAPKDRPQLWAWVGAYDHVVLAQLWGDMTALPKSMPRYTRDLRQHWELAGRPQLPPAPANAHDALADARHNLVKYQAIEAALRRRG